MELQPTLAARSDIAETCAGIADLLRPTTQPIVLAGIPYGIRDVFPLSGVREAKKGEIPDAILLTEANAAHLILHRFSPPVAAILPVIDASGDQTHQVNANPLRADLRIATMSPTWLGRALKAVEPMLERLKALPLFVFASTDQSLLLLARLFIRNRGLEPRYNPSLPALLEFSDSIVFPKIIEHADELVAQGALCRRFFETVKTCPQCRSARILISTQSIAGQNREMPLSFHCLDCDARHGASDMMPRIVNAYGLSDDALTHIERWCALQLAM